VPHAVGTGRLVYATRSRVREWRHQQDPYSGLAGTDGSVVKDDRGF
jgi:hypothetical protein